MNFLNTKIKNAIHNLKNPFSPIEQSIKFDRGLLMWFCLFMAYCLFTMSYIFGTLLAGSGQGSNGFITHYFGHGDSPPRLVIEAISWGITFGRAIGSVIVGWVIVKFTHKYATLIALVLLLFAIPAGFSPTYVGFVIMRTLFAIGGTTTIILLQPIVAAYCSQRQKGILSIINPGAANIGMIIPIMFFAINKNFSEALKVQWSYILLGTGLMVLIPLIIYILFAQRFDQFQSTKTKDAQNSKIFAKIDPNANKLSLLNFFKQKSTYLWAIIFGSWLIFAILPVLLLRHNFLNIPLAFNPSFEKLELQEHSLIYYRFIILFAGGLFLGELVVGIWPHLKARRKPYIIFILLLGFLFMLGSVASYVFIVNPSKGKDVWLFYLCGFIFGSLVWGIEGMLLYLPHEYPNANPKKMGYQFGLIWGLGYLMLTIFHILIVLIELDINNTGGINNVDPTKALIGLCIYAALALVAPIGLLFIKETRPQYPNLPKRKDFWARENH